MYITLTSKSYCMFFSSLKLQYCRTIILLNFSKKPLFQRRRWTYDFPLRKTPVAQKHRAISRQEKKHSPFGLSCDSSPLPQSLYGRTLTSQPKFLGWIDYQTSLAMVLRWRASARAPLLGLYGALLFSLNPLTQDLCFSR